MTTRVPCLKVVDPRGKLRELPLYDSSKPWERKGVVYMVKALPDGVRVTFNRDYKLIGSVRPTEAEWEAALIHSLDTWPGYSVNDQVPGDAVWFEVCGEAREPYRRSWIEKRENERWTHAKVDQTILPEVQRLLARLVQGCGEAYRHGGEELILMMPNLDTSEAQAFGEKVRVAFEGHWSREHRAEVRAEFLEAGVPWSLQAKGK
jgi:hypothetical protein